MKLTFDLKGGSGPAGLPQVPLKTGICAQNLGGTTQPLGERFYVKQPFNKEQNNLERIFAQNLGGFTKPPLGTGAF